MANPVVPVKASAIVILSTVTFPVFVTLNVYVNTSPKLVPAGEASVVMATVLVKVNAGVWSKSVRVGSSVVSVPESGPSTVSLSVIKSPSASISVSETSEISSVPLGLSPVAIALFSTKPASIFVCVIVCSAVTVTLTPGAKLAIGLPTILPESAFISATSISVIVELPVLVTTIL